jgi:hypothetical protein
LLTVEDEAEWRGVTARVFTQSGKGPLTAMRYPS